MTKQEPQPFKMPTKEEIQEAQERDKNAPRPWITTPVSRRPK